MSDNEVGFNLIDTHSHCPRIKDEPRKRLIADLYGERGKNISKVINIAITYDENIDAEDPDNKGKSIFRDKLRDNDGNVYDKLNYFAYAIHPKEIYQTIFNGNSGMTVEEKEEIVFNKLKEICSNPDNNCCAIGETGFEFYYTDPYSIRGLQLKWYEKHIQLAHELDLPLIIHHRSSNNPSLGRENANEAGINVLRKNKSLLRYDPGVIHCFVGTYDEASIFCEELSFVLGIGAAFLDDRNSELRSVVERIPLDWIVLETDSPYLKPKGINSGYKQNTPLNLPYIASEIAKLKGISIEEVAQVTTANALRVFDKLNDW